MPRGKSRKPKKPVTVPVSARIPESMNTSLLYLVDKGTAKSVSALINEALSAKYDVAQLEVEAKEYFKKKNSLIGELSRP